VREGRRRKSQNQGGAADPAFIEEIILNAAFYCIIRLDKEKMPFSF
jgi:hypothetical protein